MVRTVVVVMLGLVAVGAWAATPEAGRARVVVAKGPARIGDGAAHLAATWRTSFSLSPADLRGRTRATLSFLLRTAEAKQAPGITLNRLRVTAAPTRGQSWERVTCEVPVGVLRPGANTLELTAPNAGAGRAECDFMEVTLLLHRRAPYFSAPTEGFDPPAAGVRKGFGGPWYGGKVHTGVDVNWGNAKRLPVHAVADGVVRYAGPFGEGWSDMVLIEHQGPEGPMMAVYGHIIVDKAIGRVKLGGNGTTVKQGQVVGVIDPGLIRSLPHLHFGLFAGGFDGFPTAGVGSLPPRDFPGGWVDPSEYIKR